MGIKFAKKLAQGHERLLRINDTQHYNWLEGDFRMYKYVADAGLNIMRPVSMGKFSDGNLAYQLYTWFEGEDLVDALPRMSGRDKFLTGVKAGRLMKKLHALPPMGGTEPWEVRFGGKVEDAVDFVRENPDSSRYGIELAEYISENMGLMKDRPLSFTHGDWNPENLMLLGDGSIGIIDLSGENDYADPWWEFRDVFCGAASAEFFTGQIKGYFDGEPPMEFFKLLSVYIAHIAIEYLSYREEGDTNDDTVTAMKWFDGMRNPVPKWYMPEMRE